MSGSPIHVMLWLFKVPINNVTVIYNHISPKFVDFHKENVEH